jgi:hypothetical protein
VVDVPYARAEDVPVADTQAEWLRETFEVFHPLAPKSRWKDWAEDARRVNVEVRPGGKAVMRHPGRSYSVEVWWRGHYMVNPEVLGISVTPDADQVLRWEALDLGLYLAALHVALRPEDGPPGQPPRHSVTPDTVTAVASIPGRVQPAPPAPGKPPSTLFYRRLLDEYDDLLAQGHRNPIRELAQRHPGEDGKSRPSGTVKSWLARGRYYLDRGPK